jgi:hypothetical protein
MRDQRAEVSLRISPDEQIDSEPQTSRDFRILVLGDFSGRGDDAPLTQDMPRRVDRDDLDANVARVAPRLHLEIDGAPVDLAFASMDDFHPDRLVARMSALLGAFPASARAHSPPGLDVPQLLPAMPDIARAVSGTSLLEDMLDDTGGDTAGTPSAGGPSTARPVRRDELSAFVERAVTPHLVRPPDADTSARNAARQRELLALLRRVLHHPRVQALEAAWRALELLVRRLDTDGALHLFMLDVSRERIAPALERLAARKSATGEDSWTLVVALHSFAEGPAGADSLAAVAMAARTLGAPCIAAAPRTLTGAASPSALDDDERSPAPPPDVFDLIRRSIEGRFLGLTFPRFLLRAPYGRDNPCDTIEFEELEDATRHDDYLWGSGAALVALLIGEAFTERGWALGPRIPLDVGSLPYFTYRRGPETVAKSCAEMIMSERVARHLLSRGLMPLAWIKDTDRVRLVELRSVADPSAPLAAAWVGAMSGSGA